MESTIKFPIILTERPWLFIGPPASGKSSMANHILEGHVNEIVYKQLFQTTYAALKYERKNGNGVIIEVGEFPDISGLWDQIEYWSTLKMPLILNTQVEPPEERLKLFNVCRFSRPL